MIKTCVASGKKFEVTEGDLKFYERFGVPVPTLCPRERERRRLAFRNVRNLYHRTCDGTGKKMLSIYSSDKPFPVYTQDYYWSDQWDPKSYGQEFDFGRPFFEQFQELFVRVPKMNVIAVHNENSDFCNLTADCRNCYLIFESSNNEDCYYGYWLQKCRNCVDCNFMHDSELCYECENCYSCYGSSYLFNCKNCSDSMFLESCVGCKNCFGSANLQNKEYYFLNEKCSKEEYFQKLKDLDVKEYSQGRMLLESFLEFRKKHPHKYGKISNSENCTGDYIEHSKNCQHCFHAHDAEECRYAEHVWRGAKYVMDVSTTGRGAELMYECINSGLSSYGVKFASQCWETSDLDYCINCNQVSDLFGCTGMKSHDRFCILNKQYSEEEYFELKGKIIEHMTLLRQGFGGQEWGEFFPVELSPFAYNETVAQEDFPLVKEEVLKRGWAWKDDERKSVYQGPKYEIPGRISETEDEILEKILECELCSKNYRVVKAELAFYRKMGLPVPHFCPDCRHNSRLQLRNPRELFERECGKCGAGIQTTFSLERPEEVYCEKCYLSVVV